MFNNSNMFGNNPFSLENLLKLQQMLQYNQVNNYQIVNLDKYAEILNLIGNLSSDEKSFLTKDPDFLQASSIYEQSVLNFVLSQFRNQFNTTPEGIKLLNNLENSATKAIKGVKDIVEKERAELRELSELIKNNPELLEQLNKQR